MILRGKEKKFPILHPFLDKFLNSPGYLSFRSILEFLGGNLQILHVLEKTSRLNSSFLRRENVAPFQGFKVIDLNDSIFYKSIPTKSINNLADLRVVRRKIN